jgi:actin
MTDTINYASIVIDLGSGIIKAGFTGEDGPRSFFNSVVGIPKMPGLLIGMESRERYVGQEALEKLEIMNLTNPIKNGEIVDWEKFNTLMHHIFYTELKVTPEEISIIFTDTPLNSQKNRCLLTETMFETFNIEKIYLANSSMLGLYSYGKTTGLVIDSGYGVTSCVPIYEGYPLSHASLKINFAGENLSNILYNNIANKVGKDYKGIKGFLMANDIKEKLGQILLSYEEESKSSINISDYPNEYTLPDGKSIVLGNEIFGNAEELFRSSAFRPINKSVIDSLNRVDGDIINDIKENICLTGGTTMYKGFYERLKYELEQDNYYLNIQQSNDRQFANWVGGSIMSSLNTFSHFWVTRNEYDEIGDTGETIDSKCF